MVGESLEAVEHCGQNVAIESGVDSGGEVQQGVLVVMRCQGVDVGEVSGFGAVEQCDEFAAGEFVGGEGGAGDAGGGGHSGRGVHDEIDQEVFGSVDEQSAEGVGVVDALDGPAPGVGGVFELVAGVGRGAVATGGEEIQVLGGAGREVLREQCGSARIFAAPTEFAGHAIDLAGDSLTGDALARYLADAIGRPLTYRRVGADTPTSDPLLAQLMDLVDDGRLAGRADVAALRRRFPFLTTFPQWLSGPGRSSLRAVRGGDQ